MKGFVRHGMIGVACLLVMMTQVGCSTIDEDLSDCPPEGNDYEMVYELQLVTNITTELQTQLTTQTEQQVADALYNHLTNVFTAYAQDIDLSFYDVDEERELLHHESHDMNGTEKSYSLYLPKHQYRHLALANLEDNSWVKKEGGEQSSTLTLQQKKAETVESHETGLFREGRGGSDFPRESLHGEQRCRLGHRPTGAAGQEGGSVQHGFCHRLQRERLNLHVCRERPPRAHQICSNGHRPTLLLLCQLPLAHEGRGRQGTVGVPCLCTSARWYDYGDYSPRQGAPACRTAQNHQVLAG